MQNKKLHPALIVVAVTFVSMLVSAGVRSAPSVLIFPLQIGFGWTRSEVSLGAASGILLYGITAPFAAALMNKIGIRKVLIGGLALMALSSLASLWMDSLLGFYITWGCLSGIGSGAVASTLGVAVINRWFAARRGLAMGLLGASTATGSLIFVPLLAWLSDGVEWQPIVVAVTLASALLVPLAFWLVPDSPEGCGVKRYGASTDDTPMARPSAGVNAFMVLQQALGRPVFWLLASSFFVCGLTTNGLVGTHLVAYCGDAGIKPIVAGGLLALMGTFDLIGTTASGWLTDRYNPKLLLAIYYGIRGISLIALPFTGLGEASLLVFALLFGLNWIATLPPTVRIINEEFGEAEGPIIYGWIQLGHQVGAAAAAFGAGVARDLTGNYDLSFVIIGLIALAMMGTMAFSARHRVHVVAGI